MMRNKISGQTSLRVPTHALDVFPRYTVHARPEALRDATETTREFPLAGPAAGVDCVGRGPVCYVAAVAVGEEGGVGGDVGYYGVDWGAGEGEGAVGGEGLWGGGGGLGEGVGEEGSAVDGGWVCEAEDGAGGEAG